MIVSKRVNGIKRHPASQKVGSCRTREESEKFSDEVPKTWDSPWLADVTRSPSQSTNGSTKRIDILQKITLFSNLP